MVLQIAPQSGGTHETQTFHLTVEDTADADVKAFVESWVGSTLDDRDGVSTWTVNSASCA
jgi:hypothetical protein